MFFRSFPDISRPIRLSDCVACTMAVCCPPDIVRCCHCYCLQRRYFRQLSTILGPAFCWVSGHNCSALDSRRLALEYGTKVVLSCLARISSIQGSSMEHIDCDYHSHDMVECSCQHLHCDYRKERTVCSEQTQATAFQKFACMVLASSDVDWD